MPRPPSHASAIPNFDRCNLEHGAAHSPFYWAPLEARSELPRRFPHRHSYYHLIWVTQGSGRHMIDFRDYPVVRNSIFVVIPGQIHFWAVAPETQGYVFNFGAELFPDHGGESALSEERLRTRVDGNPVFMPDSGQSASIAALVEQIAGESRERAAWGREIMGHLFLALLMRVLRIDQAAAIPGHSSTMMLVQRFRTLVERRFLETSSIPDYAKALGVSERTLSEATRRVLGTSPKKLVQDRLLLEAKRLLIHSDMGVSKVAFHLNFEDPAYFGRFFRKHVALTPGAFKRAVAAATAAGS